MYDVFHWTAGEQIDCAFKAGEQWSCSTIVVPMGGEWNGLEIGGDKAVVELADGPIDMRQGSTGKTRQL